MRERQPAPAGAPGEEERWAALRARMVEDQIVRRGVHDARVLEAMRTIPRHLFVPPHLREESYEDYPLPIGEGQTISQPYIVALMTELLGLSGGESVLEVGTGSGYQAAVLSLLAREVCSVELVPGLGLSAAETLRSLGCANVNVRIGDGTLGWEGHGPFDAVIGTAAPPDVPPPLLGQLREGGRLVIPVGTWHQELIVCEKGPQGVRRREVIPVRFVPMHGAGLTKDGRR